MLFRSCREAILGRLQGSLLGIRVVKAYHQENNEEKTFHAINKKLPSDNPQLAEFHDQLIIEYLAQLDEEDIIQKVKAEIIAQLPSGNVTQETVARKIYISTRNMQRRLQKEGTTFNTIQNETRLDLAMQYLTDKHDDMTEIAFLLGFRRSVLFHGHSNVGQGCHRVNSGARRRSCRKNIK